MPYGYGTQLCMDLSEELDVRISAGQRNPYLSYGDADQRTDLSNLSRMGALGLGQLRSLQSQSPQHLQQHIGNRGAVHTQLIAAQVVRTGAVTDTSTVP